MTELPTRSQLEDELARTRDELAAAQRNGGNEERNTSGARTAIAVAIITGIFAFGPPLVSQNEPVVTNCVAQRADAIELVKNSGVWVELPPDSNSQEECGINQYVKGWQEQNRQDPVDNR